MMKKIICCFGLALHYLFAQQAVAHSDITLKNLKLYSVPETPGLLDGKNPIIRDQTAAIQLGKSLFWDTNVGSKGIACASCHFHAGADRRVKNQLNPGQLHSGSATSQTFEQILAGDSKPNSKLSLSSFPFYQLQNPDDINSKQLFSTDDVVGSSGSSSEKFVTTSALGSGEDICNPEQSSIFHEGSNQFRQTTKRNAPTVINSAFNRRNFWDGRANNEFNGVSVFGPRDLNARIWISKANKTTAQKLSLVNASLASQAVGPALDMIEMSCSGRTFKDIAKKLLTRKALDAQLVHTEDSVLGVLKNTSGNGLNITYEELIKKAFDSMYWQDEGIVVTDQGKKYNQIEANFSMFFGLAIQMYENTLISDDSKWDKGVTNLDDNKAPTNFSDQEKLGLKVFEDTHCDLCHSGPTFTSATNSQIYSKQIDNQGNTFVDRIGFTPANTNNRVDNTIVDKGFFNTSVVSTENDIGLGGKDPWGNPLSYSEQYAQWLQDSKNKIIDKITVLACNFTNPFVQDYSKAELKVDSNSKKNCFSGNSVYSKIPQPGIAKNESGAFDQGRLSRLSDGAFKIPTLRNIELTGPYMHNGSMKSLEEVVEFYNRGGNYHNRRHPDTLVFSQRLNQTEKNALITFLKTLTDERVRWEKAPFDHPAIKIPHGHGKSLTGLGFDDEYEFIPAVGKLGLTEQNGPLKPFTDYLN